MRGREDGRHVAAHGNAVLHSIKSRKPRGSRGKRGWGEECEAWSGVTRAREAVECS